MVDPRKYRHFAARVRPSVTASALTRNLERLANHSDDSVVSAAHATLQYLRKSGPLDARSFDKVYCEIVRQGKTLSRDRQLNEWRTVRDAGAGVYHALLWQFREDVTAHRGRRRWRQRRAAERYGRKPAGA